MWEGELTVDDLVEPVPMEACIDRAMVLLNYGNIRGLILLAHATEKLHLAGRATDTSPYQTPSNENTLIEPFYTPAPCKSDEGARAP